jgi:hypothetical protein
MLARVRGAFASALLLAVSFVAGVASASPSARLVYSRSADAASCPDEVALRSAVAARVGYDPFFPSAKRAILASTTRRGRDFVASVELVDEDGIAHGARGLHVDGDCGGLIDAAALAIAIDPTLLERPTPAPSPPPKNVHPPQDALPIPPTAASATPPPPAAPPATVVAPTRRSIAFDASGGVAVSAGVAPREALGARVDTYVYWADGVMVGTIMRAPKAGGTATIVAHDADPVAIAVDANAIYWSDEGGNIMRLAK